MPGLSALPPARRAARGRAEAEVARVDPGVEGRPDPAAGREHDGTLSEERRHEGEARLREHEHVGVEEVGDGLERVAAEAQDGAEGREVREVRGRAWAGKG